MEEFDILCKKSQLSGNKAETTEKELKKRSGITPVNWGMPLLFIQNVMEPVYGLKPIPPSRVRVSPERYLKSGEASCTQTRPISFSTSP